VTSETRDDIYSQVKAQGLLTGIQLDLFEFLYCSGAMTAGELACLYKDKYPETDRSRNEIAKRVSDLAATGAIEKCDNQRKCPTTKKMINVWQLSGLLPTKPRAKLSHKEALKRLSEIEEDLAKAELGFRVAVLHMSNMGSIRGTPGFQKFKDFYDKYVL